MRGFLTFLLILAVGAATDVVVDNKKLVMIQALWRHGDRSPTETFKSDYFQESSWNFGGGGWGQLSPIGMRQHMELGQKIRNRYVDGNPYNFLSNRYQSKEVYVRSTDINRTLASAFSNMLGMYGQDVGSNVADLDYPVVKGWPTGLVPIPIHTIDDATDHLIDVDNTCPFQDAVWGLSKQTPQVSAFINRPDVVANFTYLSQVCGQPIDVDNLWIVYSALKIEKEYFANQLPLRTPWYSDQLLDLIDVINDQVQDFQNGNFDSVMAYGLDLPLTLRKIRSGTLINDMMKHMALNVKCAGQNTSDCTYSSKLKYFAYSAHDSTIYAFFSGLGVEHFALQPPGHYPEYSACIMVELWQDLTTKQNFFKMLFHRNSTDDFSDDITKEVPGCENSNGFCDLGVWQGLADAVKPDMEMNQWCQVNPIPSTVSPRPTSVKLSTISVQSTTRSAHQRNFPSSFGIIFVTFLFSKFIF